jgi:hypothetical protein
VLGGTKIVVEEELGEGQVASPEAEVMLQDSGKNWAQGLQRCYGDSQVATTVQTDIDTENYQRMAGPPSTHDYSKS